jgi:glycosyltransferase involved in cell wall biosynthesis
LFVRPSFADGDALSVREALSLGVPVLASDVVPRPMGCAVFRAGDFRDLVSKIETMIEKEERSKDKVKANQHTGFFEEIKKLYLEL